MWTFSIFGFNPTLCPRTTVIVDAERENDGQKNKGSTLLFFCFRTKLITRLLSPSPSGMPREHHVALAVLFAAALLASSTMATSASDEEPGTLLLNMLIKNEAVSVFRLALLVSCASVACWWTWRERV